MSTKHTITPVIGRDTTRAGSWTVSYLNYTRYYFRKAEAQHAARLALTMPGYWNTRAVAACLSIYGEEVQS